eukprot:10233857-Alexandrium_andersonii.AAC.1
MKKGRHSISIERTKSIERSEDGGNRTDRTECLPADVRSFEPWGHGTPGPERRSSQRSEGCNPKTHSRWATVGPPPLTPRA